MSHGEGRCRPCWPEGRQSCKHTGALSHRGPVSRAETVRHWLYTAVELITLLTCSNTEGRCGTLGLQKDGPASHTVPFLLGAASPRLVKVPSLPLPCPALFPNQPHGFYCLSCGCLRVCRAKNHFSGVQELGGSSMSICHFTPDQGYSFTSAKGL